MLKASQYCSKGAVYKMSKIDWKMLSSSSNAANTSIHISTQFINFEEGHRQVQDPPPGIKVSSCPPSLWGVISSAIILIFKNSWNLHVSAYFSCFVTGELDRLHIIPAAFTRFAKNLLFWWLPSFNPNCPRTKVQSSKSAPSPSKPVKTMHRLLGLCN